MTQQFKDYKKWFSDHEEQKQFPSSLTQSMQDSVFGWKAWQAAQAAQPAQVPLSDDVLIALENEVARVVGSRRELTIGFARTIEAHHGIAAPSTKEDV